MGIKRGFIFTLFLLTGLVLGGVLTEVASRVSFLTFLTWGKSIGVGGTNPVVIDLSVVQFTFGVYAEMNLAILLCLIGSLLFYHNVGKRI